MRCGTFPIHASAKLAAKNCMDVRFRFLSLVTSAFLSSPSSSDAPQSENLISGVVTLARIAECLPYPSRRVTIAFGYNRAWRKERDQAFFRHWHYSFTARVAVCKPLVSSSCSKSLYSKADSNALIRVWEKRMKSGELHGVR